MIFDLVIGSTSLRLLAGSFELTETANRRCVCSFQIDSADRSYRPPEGEEFTIEEDGNRIFGGVIDAPSEAAQAGCRRPGIRSTVHGIDFTVYAERRFFNGTLAAGTLKSQLTTLVALLSGYGVTLDAGQVDGPTLPALTYNYKRVDVVLNELMTLTADASGQPFLWEIDYFKVLRAYQPSTEPAPFDLIGNDLPTVVGDIEVETRRSDQYANRVILIVAPKTEIGRVETIIGDGTAGPFPLTYTLTHLTYGIMLLDTGGGETLQVAPAEPQVQWEYDPATNSMTRQAGNTVNGTVYSFTFDGVFSGVWTAEDAAEIASVGLWERVINIDSVPSDAAGQAFADAELAKHLAPIITVKYKTWEQGITIGQEQTINVSARNVNGVAVIANVVSRDLVHRLERSVTAVIDDAQTNLGRSFQDDYEIWYGDTQGGGGVSVSVGDGGVASVGPSLPVRSVQYHDEDTGGFGGDAEFTYNKATDSLVCGELSDITAENHRSCAVFGYDNHIDDP